MVDAKTRSFSNIQRMLPEGREMIQELAKDDRMIVKSVDQKMPEGDLAKRRKIKMISKRVIFMERHHIFVVGRRNCAKLVAEASKYRVTQELLQNRRRGRSFDDSRRRRLMIVARPRCLLSCLTDLTR
jgi:hypothetical protein